MVRGPATHTGVCHRCGRRFTITRNGVVRAHRSPAGASCRGSHSRPRRGTLEER